MTYKILTRVMKDDKDENNPKSLGAPGYAREDAALKNLEKQLKTTLAVLNSLAGPDLPAPRLGLTDLSSAGGIAAVKELGMVNRSEKKKERIAPALPEIGHREGQVARGVKHWEARIARDQIPALNASIIKLRQGIAKAGGKSDADGNVFRVHGHGYVAYDHMLYQQGLTRIEVRGGELYDRNGKLDTLKMTSEGGDGTAIYVMSAEGNIHVSSQEKGVRHHSSLLAGADVAGAGEIKVTNGKLQYLSNESGHYLPYIDHFLQVLHHLQRRGVVFGGCTICYVSGDFGRDRKVFHPPLSIEQLLKDQKLDDESYHLNNLMLAYSHLLTPEVLDPQGWMFKADPFGVYWKPGDIRVPHREVRSFLRRIGVKGDTVVQPTGDF